MTIRAELLEILACPKCKQPVKQDESGKFIICPACRLYFSIRDDIPVMLLDEAQPFEGWHKRKPPGFPGDP